MKSQLSTPRSDANSDTHQYPATLPDQHVVLLTNFIPPADLNIYTELARRVGKLTVLLSTAMEANRQWQPDWGTLDVRLQKTWTFRPTWRHPAGFTDSIEVHVPRDTIRLLKELSPDVVLSEELGFRSLASALYTMRSRRSRLILWTNLSEHTERGRGWSRYALRKWLLQRADAVLYNGPSCARYLNRLGTDPWRMHHVPYAALPFMFDHLPLTRSPEVAHRLIYVGRLVELKGLVPFVRELASWASRHGKRRVEFSLAGTGPVRSQLEAMSLPDNLTLNFLGYQQYDQLPQCYAEAGIFVLPTLSDEWGMVVNEAMAAGLPVLGSVYSQAVETLCVDGKTGWRFLPDAPEEMQAAIDAALTTSPEHLNTMRAAARGAVAHLTPQYSADCLVKAIAATRPDRRRTRKTLQTRPACELATSSAVSDSPTRGGLP